MSRWYAFNGDADGLCALQQLRLDDPGPARLVTGVKRDVQLVKRLECVRGDEATILDIALDQNRDDVRRLLENDVTVRYFDHHYPGDVPRHARFHGHIDTAADVCTSILVDRHRDGRHSAWAIVAAFGDGLEVVAGGQARTHGYSSQDAAVLRRLGMCLNYNAYGESITDLHWDPAQLAEAMRPFGDPLTFARDGEVFARLSAGYDHDMSQARALRPVVAGEGAMLVVMPNAAWARRAIGAYANELAQRRTGTRGSGSSARRRPLRSPRPAHRPGTQREE